MAFRTMRSSGRRDVGVERGGPDRLLADVLVGDGDRALAIERHAAREHLVEDDAQGVQVRASVDRLALRLLGRQVRGRAEDGRGLGQRLAARGAGDAEVHDLHVARGRDHDVAGLDVAVDDPALVREGEARGDGLGDLGRPLG